MIIYCKQNYLYITNKISVILITECIVESPLIYSWDDIGLVMRPSICSENKLDSILFAHTLNIA